MFRILWVYFNVFIYFLFHFFSIRKRYKHPEKYTVDEKFMHSRRIGNLIVKKSGSKVIVEGKENLLDDSVLYACNHPSMIDPYFISYATQKQMGATIAGDLWFEKIPVINPWFQSFGCVYIDRKNPRKGIEGIKKAIQNIKKGHSLLLFPEGDITRMTTDESLGRFHTGGFKIATKSKVPIIPIAVIGTDKIYEAYEVIGKLKKGTVVIKILKPYIKHIHENLSDNEVANDIRNLIKKEIEQTKIPG